MRPTENGATIRCESDSRYEVDSALNEDTSLWYFRNDLRQRSNRMWRISFRLALLLLLFMSIGHRPSVGQTASSDRTSGKTSNAKPTEKSRKYVNKIPYDVFFDDPLRIVSSQTKPVVSTVPSPTPDLGTTSPLKLPQATSAKLPSAGGWSKLIDIEDLQSEIKTMRSDLTKSLSNAGQYNQNFKSIAVDGGCVAALAVIVQQHEQGLGWKPNARYVRDFGAQINLAATGLGRERFEQTKSAFERLTTVLDGSIPADAGEVDEVRPVQEVASRKSLMKRIERAKDWLKQDVNSESKFKSQTDAIRHEAAILAAFATVISMPGYEYVDNQDYQNFAKALTDGAVEAAGATSAQSYDDFQRAIDKVNKSCTDCHSAYGNG